MRLRIEDGPRPRARRSLTAQSPFFPSKTTPGGPSGHLPLSSLRELRAALRRFISYYNRHLAHPYRWTYTGTPCRA
jgi:hypothetical protein